VWNLRCPKNVVCRKPGESLTPSSPHIQHININKVHQWRRLSMCGTLSVVWSGVLGAVPRVMVSPRVDDSLQGTAHTTHTQSSRKASLFPHNLNRVNQDGRTIFFFNLKFCWSIFEQTTTNSEWVEVADSWILNKFHV
jgi:hypothetical protein